ncbi:TldD/PmbA family protein [candidate division WOR-3 bacterium]|nr:TldD/PmbA family protein [candidate division WOR-3 bacterium]
MDEKKSREILNEVVKKGAQKSALLSFKREIAELNVEKDKINFFRSTQNNEIQIEAYCDNRKADITLNNFSNEDIKNTAELLLDMCMSAVPDEANDISPENSVRRFMGNSSEPDIEKMNDAFQEFLDEAKSRYPEVIFSDSFFSHKKSEIAYANTNGCYFTQDRSFYNVWLFFTAKRDKNISSFNYFSLDLDQINGHIVDKCGLDSLLKNSVEHIESIALNEKFKGDLIVTPKAMLEMSDDLLYPLHENRLITGTSIYSDKLGEKIASPLLNIKISPLSDKSVFRDYFTFDGFLTEDMDVIKDGILKSYFISYYGSRKTGLPRSKNLSGNHTEILPGDQDLQSMIQNVKKGIFLDRFSGGSPSVGGEISGVCKNSYYIENGRIKCPVKEIMMTANTAEMLLNIDAVSKETTDYGNARSPYVLIKDVSFS